MSSISEEEFAAHRDAIRAMVRTGGPLDPAGSHASVNNPDWFINGYPVAARRDLHTRLIAEYRNEQGDTSPDRSAIVLAGPPGVGKSAVREKLLTEDSRTWLVIDPDAFKCALLKQALADGSYESFLKPAAVRDREDEGEMFFPLELASLVHEESSILAKRLRREAISNGESIVIDTVLAKVTSALAVGRQLSDADYTVMVVDVETTYEISQARVANRWRSAYEEALDGNDELGGRWVPSDFAREVFSGPGGRSLSEHAAQQLAHEVTAVARFRRYWVDEVDAAPQLTTCMARSHRDAALEDA